MDDKKQFSRRLLAIGALFSLVLAAYFVTLFDAQIVHGAEYRARSIRANTKSEAVVTSRGILTDRNGKALVTNRSVYTLELDTSLAPSDDAALNKELLRLIELLENRGIVWEDTLPLTAGAPFAYDFSVSGSHTALNSYLVSKKWADEDALTTDTDPPLSTEALLSRLRTEFKADEDLTDTEARKLVGLRYCLAVTKLNQLSTAAIASDISVELIAELKDGAYAPIHIGTSSVREYQTDAAAHILGRVTKIPREKWNEYKEKGYAMNAYVGYDGVELAFEDYLRGRNGRRIVETNTAGKVTGEIYSVEPEPGNTVALTLDIDFQEDVERILAETVESMTAEDDIGRGRGGGAGRHGRGALARVVPDLLAQDLQRGLHGEQHRSAPAVLEPRDAGHLRARLDLQAGDGHRGAGDRHHYAEVHHSDEGRVSLRRLGLQMLALQPERRHARAHRRDRGHQGVVQLFLL